MGSVAIVVHGIVIGIDEVSPLDDFIDKIRMGVINPCVNDSDQG